MLGFHSRVISDTGSSGHSFIQDKNVDFTLYLNLKPIQLVKIEGFLTQATGRSFPFYAAKIVTKTWSRMPSTSILNTSFTKAVAVEEHNLLCSARSWGPGP